MGVSRQFTLIFVLAIVLGATPALAHHKVEHEGGPPTKPTECVHPYPCGDEWPKKLIGRTFEVGPLEQVRVPSSTFEVDGVELNGWIIRPVVPDGVKVPVLLHSTPYLGDCRVDDPLTIACGSTPEDPEMLSDDYTGPRAAIYQWGTPALGLVRQGYALAMFSVRGTGRSGGCFQFMSPTEQADQAGLVEWAGSQTWSNGRVAMGGISAPAATAWEAAVSDETPNALKTIVTAGIVSDPYLIQRSPQGAPVTYGIFSGGYQFNPLVPAVGGAQHWFDQEGAIADAASSYPARLCAPETPEKVVPLTTLVGPDRSEAYWAERRLIDRFDRVTAAVLLAQGFQDDGHDWQDDIAWQALESAPKRRLVGQWAHDFPYGDDYPNSEYRVQLDPSWENSQWGNLVLSWLDYWLKGIGSPERIGLVDYQDNNGVWHASRVWPPMEAKEEAIYLAGGKLAAESDGSSRSFRSSPDITNSYEGGTFLDYKSSSALCGHATGATLPTGVSYLSDPLEVGALVAGNAFAYLRLRTDQPGGLITANLFDIGSDFACDDVGRPSDIRFIDRAAADLRFHGGNFVAEDFPTTATNVRLDFPDFAYSLPAGHRLGLTLSYGETHVEYFQAPFFPKIEVIGDGNDLASHLVLPIVDGTFWGAEPKLEYPVRPFSPS